MKARLISSVAAAGVLALVISCSEDQTRVISAPTAAAYGKGNAPTCSFSTATNDAKAYFVDSKDQVFALLDAMQTQYRLSPTSAATTEAGMNVLARIGTAAQNGMSKVKGTPETTGALGNTFANDVLLCMGVAAIPFTDALGPTGLFAVRDGTAAHAQAVVAHKWDAGGSPITGAPLYGAERTGATWPLAQKTLFYARLVTTTALADETPSGAVFDLKTLPADLTFVPEIRAGVCDVADESARILHAHAGNAVVLPPAGVPSFCANPPALDAYRSGFGSMMDLAASWFTPQPLFAMPAFGGGGGLVSGLSEIGPVTYTSVVSFTVPPKNTKLSASPQFPSVITVTDTTANGNPLKGVLITLNVVGNSGSFTNPPVGSTATTNAFGIAVFPNLFIDKAGGYTVTATSEVGGSASAFFNISGR
jgi:hypothetical protein